MEISSESVYTRLMRAGQRMVRQAQQEGRDPYLPALEEMIPSVNELTHVALGIRTVPLDSVVGTLTAGRTPAFSSDFKPLLELDTEFSAKWRLLYESVAVDGVREAVKLVEYMHRYYAIEGNKRISVSKELKYDYIEADVTRIIPRRTDEPENRIYFEFLSFFADTGLSELTFSEEGSYAMLTSLTGHTPGVKWPEDDVKGFRAAYHRFRETLKALGETPARVTVGDIILVYLKAFSYDEFLTVDSGVLRANLSRMRAEVTAMAQEEPLALKLSADGTAPGLLRQLLRGAPNRLKVCFINNRSPEVSGWTYWHAFGRNHVDSVLKGRVETEMIDDVAPADCQAAIEQAVKRGAQVVFTTSPVMLEGAMKAAMKLPEAKILNCSLLPEYHAVRSYYLRIYEAKFVLGAIAGAVCENDRIGYIADYPVYGIPASINAFALGARLTDPRAKIYLQWSTVAGADPEAALAEQDARVISNRDIAAPSYESKAFGLYWEKDGKQQSLAMPVWNWGKMYEDLIGRILSGVWDNDVSGRDAKALNYWWGMDEGAIDVYYSSKLDAGTRRVIELLRKGIIAGTLKPFADQIVSQDGTVRCHDGEELTPAQIMTMDWLCDNVVGSIP